MTNINPFGPRIAVVEPPTEHRASGLIIVSEEEAVATGIVIRNRMVEEHDRQTEAQGEFGEAMRMAHQIGHTTIALIEEEELMLKAGVVVFYQKNSGIKIRDVIIVPLNAIIAWEA